MSWFVTGLTDPNQTSGTVTPYIFQAASEAAAEKQIGGKPLAGPFKTKADAQAWVKAHPGDFGPGKTGAKPLAPNLAAPELNSKINNPLNYLSGIADFFHRLTEAHTWLRVGEFIVGGAFLLIGLNHLLGNPAGKIARHVPKVVPV